MIMSDALLTTLRKLRLSGLAESLEIRLHEAAKDTKAPTGSTADETTRK
jgi:hypothetical protein